jgi:hypothetical protein
MSEHRKGYRGTGIYVHGGGFRISGLSLSIDRATGAITTKPVVPHLRTDTFEHWLAIGRHAADEARAARERGVEAPLEDNTEFSQAIEQEFRAGMVAIGASAFAADAFYASVVEHAPETRAQARRRAAKVFETLKRGFALRIPQQAAVRKQLGIVYVLRDQAVHPPASWERPVAHPVYGLGMEPRLVHFRAENAINAQRFVQRMIRYCVHHPKAKHAALVKWCEPFRESIPEPDDPPAWAKQA